MIAQQLIAQQSAALASTALSVQAVAAQESAAPGNTQPAKLLVIVTDARTGRPVTRLTQSNLALTNHSSPKSAVCGFSGGIRFFGDVGTGAYQIQVGLRDSIPGCAWVKGTYLGQIAIAAQEKQGQAAFALTIQ